MTKSSLLALGVATLFGATLSAQNCSDNLFPVTLVNAAGVPFAIGFDPVIGDNAFEVPTEVVYLAFPTTIASGTYYVHVTNTPFSTGAEVVSDNDPMDRFVAVTNTAGVITLSLPFSQNQNPPAYGQGIGGVGQSLRLEFQRSQYSACRFKVWFGDKWDLANGPTSPYLLAGGVQPSGACVVRSYESFRIGDGSGSDVTGSVFADGNRNGSRDSGEAGLAGREVRLVTGTTSSSVMTGSDGSFRFVDVAAGSYTVEMVVPNGQLATTPSSRPITVCDCGDLAVGAFGTATQIVPCNGRPRCHWTGCHGNQTAHNCGALWSTACLQLVNHCGQRVAPCTQTQLRNYLNGCSTFNMAHALSCELLAMHCSVAAGYVHPNAVLRDPVLGQLTVAQLMQRAVFSLCVAPFTPPGHFLRQSQSHLKNALDRGNNNQNWQ